jgi:hypothetical protein
MACEFICDHCGVREPAELRVGGYYDRPSGWSIVTGRGGDLPYGDRIDACSDACASKVKKIRRAIEAEKRWRAVREERAGAGRPGPQCD